MRVFVTVGMGPWPFDRLVSAVGPVCERHDVFVQTGTSSVVPPCRWERYLSWTETQRHLQSADVVVTHAGNTVRLVQSLGKVPIAVAREAARGEMRNDHQVDYLAAEERAGRAVAVSGDLSGLAAAVDRHARVGPRLTGNLRIRDNGREACQLGLLDGYASPKGLEDRGPFQKHPLERYRWAYAQLRSRSGRHLDLGCSRGAFAEELAQHTSLDVVGVDAHAGYLKESKRRCGGLPVLRVGEQLPFADASFSSVSMLDSLEHVPREDRTLAEVARVLEPGGVLVLTVPARHLFSFMDPDNAKFTAPRLHAWVYRTRFGEAVYEERFVDSTNGLRGDLAWSRDEHRNYRFAELGGHLRDAGLTIRVREGASLFRLFIQIPQLLLPPKLARLLDGAMRWDGGLFHRADLFVLARKETACG